MGCLCNCCFALKLAPISSDQFCPNLQSLHKIRTQSVGCGSPVSISLRSWRRCRKAHWSTLEHKPSPRTSGTDCSSERLKQGEPFLHCFWTSGLWQLSHGFAQQFLGNEIWACFRERKTINDATSTPAEDFKGLFFSPYMDSSKV